MKSSRECARKCLINLLCNTQSKRMCLREEGSIRFHTLSKMRGKSAIYSVEK